MKMKMKKCKQDADGDVVTDNSNLNDFDVVDDSKEVFTENLPIHQQVKL